MGSNQKINIVEAVFVAALVVLAEALEVVVTFFLGAGELVKWVTNIAVWLPVQLWLRIKGMRGEYYAVATVVEFIPFLNTLPIKSITLIVTIYRHNRQFKDE